jgi:hypothetical protein
LYLLFRDACLKSMSPNGKRQRLLHLASIGKVADTALCRIANSLREEPLDCDVSRKKLYSTYLDEYGQVEATIQLPLAKGGSFKWSLASPAKELQYFCKRVPGFRALVATALGSHGHKLSMILYVDEATPGNVLRPQNMRKMWDIFWSIKEFGPHRLCMEEVWMPLAILRTEIVKKVDGGFGNCMRLMLRHCFVKDCGGDELSTRGVAVVLDDRTALVLIDFGKFIADLAGIQYFWNHKGSSGILPCFKCKNLVSKQCGLAGVDPYLVTHSCTDPNRFDISSDEDVWRKFDTLAEQLSLISIGFTFNACGVLSDLELRQFVKPSSTVFDWMHTALQHGVVTVDFHLFFQRCKKQHNITFPDIQVILDANWAWPKHIGSLARQKVNGFFSENREKSCALEFKAMASEMLTIFPLVRYFAEKVAQPLGNLDKECKSLLLACEVLDELLLAKRQCADSKMLEAALRSHLDAHMACYGEDNLKPKHHAIWHTLFDLFREPLVLDTFALERKHKKMLAIADFVLRTSVFEQSVMMRAIAQQAVAMQSVQFKNGLVGKIAAAPRELLDDLNLAACDVASATYCIGQTYSIGDLVFLDGRCYTVCACCSAAAVGDFLVFDPMRLVGKVSDCSSRWQASGNRVMFVLSKVDVCLTTAHCWSSEGDGVSLVLHASRV